jgi:hypothetical protein
MCSDHRSLLDKLVVRVNSLAVALPFHMVADTYYAASIIRPLLKAGQHLVAAVRSTAVAYEAPPHPERPGGGDRASRSFRIAAMCERARAAGRCVAVGVSPAALDRMRAHDWPGNLDELGAWLLGACLRHPAVSQLSLEHLGPILPSGEGAHASALPAHTTLGDAVAAYERALILEALERCDGVQTRAARLLGTTRRILRYRMDGLGIPAPSGTRGRPPRGGVRKRSR